MDALVQQLRVDLWDRQIDEAIAVQEREYHRTLFIADPARGRSRHACTHNARA